MDAQGRLDLGKRLAGRSRLSVALESTVTIINLLSAIGGNLLVCWTIFKHPRLRSASNIFIACLGLSDVFIAVLGFPFTLAVLRTGRWLFNKAACNFQGFTFTVFGTFSLVTMTLTAIARYFKVTRPSLHPKIYSKKNICLFLIPAFLVSTPFPISLMFNDGFFFHPVKFICIYDCDKLSPAECLSFPWEHF